MSSVYILFIHLSVEDIGLPPTFLLLWIILQWISVQSTVQVSTFFWVYTQSAIAESYHTAFNFLNYCHTIFHSHYEYTRSPLLYILINTCFFLNSQSNECSGISLCFDLNCDVKHLFACLLTICFSLRNVHSNTLPIFESSLLGFCCWLLGVLCID